MAHTLTCQGGRERGEDGREGEGGGRGREGEGEDGREGRMKRNGRRGKAESSITVNVEHTLNFQQLWCIVHTYTAYATVWG